MLTCQLCKGLRVEHAVLFVDLCHVSYNLDRLVVMTFVYQEFRRFSKVKDEEPQDKDQNGDSPRSEEQISPSHVRRSRATLLPIGDSIAGWQRPVLGKVGRTRVDGYEAISDGTADHHANWLEDGEASKQEAFVLGEELERDGRVDGDVASYAEADKGCEDEEGVVIVRGAETDAEDGSDGTRQVESPSTACIVVSLDLFSHHDQYSGGNHLTNDIRQESPNKSPCRQPSIKARRDIPTLIIPKPQLLLQGAQHHPKRMRPQQIKQIAKATQTPDVPLIRAHALGVNLAVDEHALLLVERQSLETCKGNRW